MSFVKTRVQEERQATEKRTDTAANCCAPHVGRISTLLIYNSGDIHFATGT